MPWVHCNHCGREIPADKSELDFVGTEWEPVYALR